MLIGRRHHGVLVGSACYSEMHNTIHIFGGHLNHCCCLGSLCSETSVNDEYPTTEEDPRFKQASLQTAMESCKLEKVQVLTRVLKVVKYPIRDNDHRVHF